MGLSSGTRLGTYEVRALIGAGGMGEVYEAHDSKLGRDVAIKVLPEQFAREQERLARFQREAKLLASLNHPNIATIHGLEQSEGTHYLVMELVPGDTLRERITRDGALPIEEALTIAKQIAEALEAAHNSEKGIIHRDLKPANVKVTPEGRVKVLDFGLAKAFAPERPTEDMSNSPTLSAAPTMQGVIMGTAAYMSPEQARGKAVTKATDIFAFGAVLYEMLTGKQTFQGEDVGDILATVVKTEPDWSRLPESTPPAIRTLLRRCLRKERHQRLSDAGAVRIEIEEALASPAAAPAAAASAANRWRQFLPWAAAVVLSVVTGLAVWTLRPTPAPRTVTRTVINLPPGDLLAGLDRPAVAISLDGRQLAYVATRGSVQQLYLRPMDGLEARPIAGTEGAYNPFFSPDGQWLGFFAGGSLKKILVSGGAALNLGAVTAAPRGASWGSQGAIVFTPTLAAPLQQVLDAGGASQPLTRLETGETTHRWPEFLPGGQAVLFAAGASAATSQVAVYSASTGERRTLVPSGTHPRYAPSGHLIYVQQGTLMAVPFDAARLEVTGTPVPVVEGVLQSAANGIAQYAISADGSLVYIPGGIEATQRKIVWVDRKGIEQPLPAQARAYRFPRLSPDGQRVAVTIEESESHNWLYDLRRDTLTRLTFEGSINLMGAWTPDGKRIAFDSNRAGPQNLFWQAADGSGATERLNTSEFLSVPNSWSPDGQALAFIEIRPDTGNDINVLTLSDHKVQPFLRTRFIEGAPSFSPDGRWMVYISDESGRREVYVQPYPGPGGKWQISTEGGTEPVWNRNGRELFFRSGDKMMAVDITTQPAFSAGKPRMLFEAPYVPTAATFPNYDVSPDGQRFLMLKPGEQAQTATQINVVLNWSEELKRRVPTGKQ